MKKEKNLVVKSNCLISARYRLNIIEQKILLGIISKIDLNDNDFKTYYFDVKSLMCLVGQENNKNFHRELKVYTKNLLSKVLVLKKDIGGELQTNWLSSVDYQENGVIGFCFDPKLKPYLLALKKCFTYYDYENVRKFRSKYSARLYEILKQYEKIGERRIKVSDLRYMLGLNDDEYKNYTDFKKNVLLTPQKEINENTDLQISFEEIKKGRKIDEIFFAIEVKKALKADEKDIQSEYTKKDIEGLIIDFNAKYNGHLDYSLVKNLIQLKGLDCVKDCVREFVNFVGNAKQVERVFYDFTIKYGTEKAYIKPVSYNNSKPIQSTNYEQRDFSHYTEADWYSLYDNLDYTPDSEDE